MKIQRLSLSALIALLLFWPSTAHATPITYSANLNGSSEVPPTGSLGVGFAVVTIDDVANTMEVNVNFADLSSGDTASHIHCCVPVGSNAGVATTTPTFTGFPLGVTAGTYDHVFDLTQASTYNPAFVIAQGSVAGAEAALLAGLAADEAYLNIHTSQDPGGEIRGFLQPGASAGVPEPATLLLLGTGIAAVARRRLKRRDTLKAGWPST